MNLRRRARSRRATGAIPQRTAAPLQSELLADFDASFGVASDVSTWTSRVNGHEIVQSTSGSRPSVGAINGKLALTFDGTDDGMAGAASLAAAIDGSAPYSVYVIAKLSTIAGSFKALVGASDNATHYMYHFASPTNGLDQYGRGDPTATTSGGGDGFSTTAFDFAGIYSGSAMSTWVNGSDSLVASANTRAPTCNVFSIGCLMFGAALIQPWNGQIGRVLVYAGAHDDTKRLQVSAYLRSRFSL